MDAEPSSESHHSLGMDTTPSPQSQYSFGIDSLPLPEAQDDFRMDAPPSPGASPSPQSQLSFGIDSLSLSEHSGNPPAAQEEDIRVDFPPQTEADEATDNPSPAHGESYVCWL
jgi:hypothetical protein